jgi:hypothetical protein
MAYQLAPTQGNLSKLDSWIDLAERGTPQVKVDVNGGTRRLTPKELGALRVLQDFPESHKATIDKIVRGLHAERDRVLRQLQS